MVQVCKDMIFGINGQYNKDARPLVLANSHPTYPGRLPPLAGRTPRATAPGDSQVMTSMADCLVPLKYCKHVVK